MLSHILIKRFNLSENYKETVWKSVLRLVFVLILLLADILLQSRLLFVIIGDNFGRISQLYHYWDTITANSDS